MPSLHKILPLLLAVQFLPALPAATDNARLQLPPRDTRGSSFTDDFIIDRPYLNFHIAGGRHPFRAALTLWIDGRAVRTSTGDNSGVPAPVTWDLREFQGKTAHLGIHNHCHQESFPKIRAEKIQLSGSPSTNPAGDIGVALAQVRLEAVRAIRDNAPVAATDPHRPVYHYTPPAQRMNDPNGPAWHNGWHHLFYQHMVFEGSGPAINVHWGHARSRDLVNWETLPLAIFPAYELGELSVFSGNLGRDKLNRPVQFTTSVPYKKNAARRIWLARPDDDDWIRWTKTPSAPPGLVPIASEKDHIKDAFPFSVGDRRFTVLTDKNIPVYEAIDGDFSQWKHVGTLDPGTAECPNFFQVGDRFIYLSSPHSPVKYQVGKFDPGTAAFTPQTEGYLCHSTAFYASTAYRDEKGRTILHGVTRGQKTSPAWTGALALPRVLTIGPDGHPRQHPLPELRQLRRAPYAIPAPIHLDGSVRLIPGLSGDTLEIIARFKNSGAKTFGLKIRRSADGSRCLPVLWQDGELVIGKPAPKYPCRYALDPATGEITLHLFLDKGILDVCTADGRRFETRIHAAPLEDLGVEVFAENGAATLISLEAWQLAPARIDHARLLGGE